jgi:GNAT superfamily N-acetyltransferase
VSVEIIDLNDEQVNQIENALEDFDDAHITYKLNGSVNVGIVNDGKLIAGACGQMTAFKIFYLSTVYVDGAHRRRGIGRKLMEAVEERACKLGANIIRLDTFDWQGAGFYPKLGYERVGFYESEDDGFSEHFFVKRLNATP